jgi:hypothetical protein
VGLLGTTGLGDDPGCEVGQVERYLTAGMTEEPRLGEQVEWVGRFQGFCYRADVLQP